MGFRDRRSQNSSGPTNRRLHRLDRSDSDALNDFFSRDPGKKGSICELDPLHIKEKRRKTFFFWSTGYVSLPASLVHRSKSIKIASRHTLW